jgi:hypothetical protein
MTLKKASTQANGTTHRNPRDRLSPQGAKERKMDIQELREIFADELDRAGEIALAMRVRNGADNSHGGTAAIAAMQRAIRRDEIGKFKPLVSLGFDKNGEADFRVNMSISELERPKMDELTRMIPWAIKEALSLWLEHGPPSKDMAQTAASA